MTPEASGAALSRIRYTSRPEDGADADLLSESVFEDPDVKARVFAQFNQLCHPKTVFTTNTSTLLPSMYAEATGRLGVKSGRGFYTYPNPAYLRPEFLGGDSE